MSYIIYETKTTRIVGMKNGYPSERGAKMMRTKLQNKMNKELAIAESSDFFENIEMMVTKKNLMSDEEYEEAVNTSLHMSPASETYWSM